MSDWENTVRCITPYVPGEQPKERDIIKLNTNENPFPPSPKVKEALEAFKYGDLRLYPDPDATELVKGIAELHKVKTSQVFVGVGSDDVLSVAFLTFFYSDRPVLFPDITYSFYDVWAKVYNIRFETIPLNGEMHINTDDYLRENGGIVLANPNAPTGVLESVDDIEKIVSGNPGSVVIVDEAYIDFGGESCLPLLKKYDNLLVVRTFSKSHSMAGIRIGYAIGSEKLIKYMNDIKFSINSYTMNRLTIACGAAELSDPSYFKANCDKVVRTREYAKNALKRLGFEFPDSKSNFIFAKHETVSAERIFEELKKRKIYVRHWDKPGIDNYLRITIGTSTDMRKLYDVLSDILGVKEVQL